MMMKRYEANWEVVSNWKKPINHVRPSKTNKDSHPLSQRIIEFFCGTSPALRLTDPLFILEMKATWKDFAKMAMLKKRMRIIGPAKAQILSG